MKKILTMLVVLSMLMTLVACGSAPAEKPAENAPAQAEPAVEAESAETSQVREKTPITLRLAYHPHVCGYGAVLAAEKLGYFADENITVEFVQFTAGAPELAAMASGDVDLGYLGLGAHVFAPKGQCIYLCMDSFEMAAEVMTTPESKITKLEDIKGKTFGCTAGTTSELFMLLAIQRAGLQKEDVNIVNMDASGLVAAFVSGQVDGISTFAPYTDEIRTQVADAVTIQSSYDFVDQVVTCNSWVANPKFIAENEDAVVRFMKAYLRGCQYRAENPEEVCKWVAEDLGIDYEVAASVLDKTEFFTIDTTFERITSGQVLAWYQGVLDLFTSSGQLDKAVDAADYFDEYYVLEAIKELQAEGIIE